MFTHLGFFVASDVTADSGWGFYFLVQFLSFAVPVMFFSFLAYTLYRSFQNDEKGKQPKLPKTKKQITPRQKPFNLTPALFIISGIIVIAVNIAGSKYSDRNVVLDSVLLALPFIFGAAATNQKYTLEYRTICRTIAIGGAVLFLFAHYT